MVNVFCAKIDSKCLKNYDRFEILADADRFLH